MTGSVPTTLILALALAASSDLDGCLDTGEAAQGVIPAMAACFPAGYRRADRRPNAAYVAAMKRLPRARQRMLR